LSFSFWDFTGPKPAGVNVILAQPEMIRIRIYSSMGRPVWAMSVQGQQGVNNVQALPGKLEKGIYYIKVQYGNESRRSKIQKL
jgi:hypothetical protein